MTPPLPTLTVPAGTGRINGKALDGWLRALVGRTNELVRFYNSTVLGNGKLKPKSVRPPAMGDNLKGYIQGMAYQIEAIRKTFGPGSMIDDLTGANLHTYPDPPTSAPITIWAAPQPETELMATAPAVLGGDSSILYRLRFRLRSTCQHTMFTPAWTTIRGTITATAGSTAVTGAGTVFTDDCIAVLYPDRYRPGAQVQFNGERHQLAAIDSDGLMHLKDAALANFTGDCQVSVCNWNIGYPTLDRFNDVALRAPPVGAIQYAQNVIGTPPGTITPFSGRDYLLLQKSSPSEEIALSFQAYTPPIANRDLEAYPAARDVIFETECYGGCILVLQSNNSDTAATFLADTSYPADDDPRFPALFRFRCGQMVQLDLLAIDPILPDVEAGYLQAESGAVLESEQPQEALELE